MREVSHLVARLGVAAMVLASSSAAAVVSAMPAAAATNVAVFVGYADSVRAAGDFPNPWDGSPNVTFDGCSPDSACIFDAGAIRIENDSTSSVMVEQVTAHVGPCVRTWNGALYPVNLAPGASLVNTQRGAIAGAGCAGTDPSTFDSSDLPTATCSDNGILPVVDVTVDGVTTSSVDSGQVLNTGGIDPATCLNSNESTEWVPIGSKPCPGQGLTLLPAAQTQPVGSSATVTATFANACGSPLSGAVVKFNTGSGPNAGTSGSGITDTNGNAPFSYSSLLPGTDTLQATVTNSVGFTTNSNTATVTWIIEFAPGGGSFVIGDQNAAIGDAVNFWGARWAMRNSLSGGAAPRSFKGFAEAPTTPACGQAWSTDPGNSTPPPDGPLPPFMAVVVTSSTHKSGATISGDTAEIVIVQTKPGYEPNPGHSAFGTVVAVLCTAWQGPTGGPGQIPNVVTGGAGGGSAGVSSAAGAGGCAAGASHGRSKSGRDTSGDATCLPNGRPRP